MKKLSLLLLTGMAAALHGQVALYVQDGQSMALVLDAKDKSSLTESTPMIEKNGKLVGRPPAALRCSPFPSMPPSLFRCTISGLETPRSKTCRTDRG
jgi:hypothetical protein